MLALNLSLWALGVLAIIHCHDEAWAVFCLTCTFGIATFLPATFYQFIVYFPNQRFQGVRWVLGLLYGGGDFGKTVDISTRCGFDSDCNPSNAAGVLGTMIGLSNIPAPWLAGLDKACSLSRPSFHQARRSVP